MRRLLLFLSLVSVCLGQSSRSGGVYLVSAYGSWQLATTSAIPSAGSFPVTISAGGVTTSDGRMFQPFKAGFPIAVDNGTNQETITPTSVSNCFLRSSAFAACTLIATFTKSHPAGVLIRSSSFGLQEAIADASNGGGGVVTVDSTFQGSTATITSAIGNTTVAVQDNRSGNPGVYVWNGAAYVFQAGGGGGGTIGGSGTPGKVALFNGNSTTLGPSLFADNGTTGSYTGTGGMSADHYSTTGLDPYSVESPIPIPNMTPAVDGNHSKFGICSDGRPCFSKAGAAVADMPTVNDDILGNAAGLTGKTLPSSTILLGDDAVQTVTNKEIDLPIIGFGTPAALSGIAVAPGAPGRIYVIVSGDGTHCTSGTGTAREVCRDSGTTWELVASSSGTGGGGVSFPLQSTTDGAVGAVAFGFTAHPEIGIYATQGGKSYSLTSISRDGSGVITFTVAPSPDLPSAGFFSVGSTLALAAVSDSSFNGTVTIATYSGSTGIGTTSPTGNLTPAGPLANTGTANIYELGFGGSSTVFSRWESTTANAAQSGSIRGGARDAFKTRGGQADSRGIDVPLIRGGTAITPTNTEGTPAATVVNMQVNGPHSSGVTTLSITKAASSGNWSAVAGDIIFVNHVFGNADYQRYKIVSPISVTAGGSTSVTIAPALVTSLAGGEFIVAQGKRAQCGDVFGCETQGTLFLLPSTAGFAPLNIPQGPIPSQPIQGDTGTNADDFWWQSSNGTQKAVRAGTISGTAQPLCTDASLRATTSGCPATGGAATPPFFIIGASAPPTSVITFSAGNAKLYGFYLPTAITTTVIEYNVTTPDNTANLYNIGIYDAAGVKKCEIGPTAGSVFAPSGGHRNLSMSCTLAAGKSYLAVAADVATVKLEGASNTWTFLAATSGSSSGGVLAGSISPPADSYNDTVMPSVLIH